MLINRLFRLLGRRVQVPISLTRFARVLLVSAIALFVVLTPQTVFAGQPVDPSTLNPPPPPEFNPVCYAVGGGTICDISFTQIEGPGGSGMICGSGADSYEVIGFDTRTVNGHRYYDRDGNLTQRHFREDIVGTLTNPLTGTSINFTQSDTIIHDLTIPGDISSGTETSAGLWRAFMPKGGTVLIDVGRTVFVESDGTTLFESGQHPLDAYFGHGDTSAIQPICDALK